MSIPVTSPFTQSFNFFPNGAVMVGCVQGNTTNPPTIPTTTISTSSSKGFMQKLTNKVSTVSGDITRSGVGVYTLKFSEGLPIVLDISVNVWGPSGTWASVTDYNESTRVLSFQTFAAGGAAADLATTEFAHITVLGQMAPNP